MLSVSCTTVNPKAPVVERFFWPPPPDVPRVEWIREYKSQLDIDQSSSQKILKQIMGEDAPISLVKPVELKSDPESGRLFISDLGVPGVIVLDNKRHEMRRLNTDGVDARITYPLGIVIDNDHNIYVLERRSNLIIVFDKDEKPQRLIKLENIVTRPIAICLDRFTNNIYVADAVQQKIHVLNMQGKHLFSFGGPGDGEGQFNLPISVATTSNNELIVADSFNARIQVFDINGNFKRAFGSRGDGVGDFQLIKSVAVDSDNNIYVVDGRSHDIKIFNTSGELLLVIGSFYPVSQGGKLAPGGFAIPVGIDIDTMDGIYIVDQLNKRIQMFKYLSDKKPAGNK